MALSNYTELQAAVRTEMANVSTGGLSADALADAIKRAEAKINRLTRGRQQQVLATDTMTSASRFVDPPAGMMEWINVRVKKATEADTAYVNADYAAPERIADYYSDTTCKYWFTMRQQFEFAKAVTVDHTVQFDYIKAWDIATDTTNWLLTTFPDIYLYGSCVEVSVHMRSAAVTMFKTMFDEAINDFNELEQSNRDDSQLDVSELAAMSDRDRYNILRG